MDCLEAGLNIRDGMRTLSERWEALLLEKRFILDDAFEFFSRIK